MRRIRPVLLAMLVGVLVVVRVAAVAAAPLRGAADDAADEDATPASVTAALVGTHAHVQARFAFDVDGPAVGVATQVFAIPRHGAVTAGSVIVDGTRHPLRLVPAETASRAFDALALEPNDRGGRAWAFALHGGAASVTLDVLAPRDAHVVLELALDVPTCFYRDARYLELPADWAQRLPAALRSMTREGDDELVAACGAPGDEGTRWLGFASGELARKPAGERRIGAIAGRLSLESTSFARVELDIARQLSGVPADLHTAIVIDHSRSLSADELEAQRAIVAAYLRAVPTSRVQVIAYARRAEPLLASWMIASHAAPELDRAIRALPPRNGSNLDAALAEAAAWLSRARGTRRVLVFSDERLAERIDTRPDHLRALLPPGTLAHVVRPAALGEGIERDDDALLAPFAAATEGIAASGGAGDDGRVDVTLLARPTALDHLAITATGWQTTERFRDERACEESLAEGHSCTWWGEGDGTPGPITVTGLVWNKPFRRVLHPDPSQARALARALSVAQVLDTQIQEQVDRLALAVNSVWSLFGQWGGSGGYEDLGGASSFELGPLGTIGGSADAIGIGGPSRGRGPLDLRAQLLPAVVACAPKDARVSITVESTLEEIVDVAVEVTPQVPGVHDCLVEAVWDTTLRIADAPPHATTRVAFDGTHERARTGR